MNADHQTAIAAGDAILAGESSIADKVTELQLGRQPDIAERFGPRGIAKTRQDTMYNLKYLSQSVQIQSPLLFSNYITWLKILLSGYKVTAEDLAVNLTCINKVLCDSLPEELYAIVQPYLKQALIQVEAPIEEIHSFLEQSDLREEASRYTELLLEGNRAAASELVIGLVQNKVSVEDIYMGVFQQAQYEIGRLWQLNRISVAQEHYFTAATQSIMSLLYPYIFSSPVKGRRMVAACVGEELHEIGLRMVSDIFQLHGWDTYYIGANVPTSSIARTVCEREADVLAVSATMMYHVSLVRKLIEEIRADRSCAGIKILVGGMPFNIDPNLWKQVGADAYAPDARAAIQAADTLFQAKKQVQLH